MTLARFVSGAIVAIAVLVTPPVTVAFDGATWIRTYGGGYGHSVYETPDGGAILGGTFGAGFDCCRPWLIKLAIEGGCNAVASTFGVLGIMSRKYAHKIPFIVKINHNELMTYPNSFELIMGTKKDPVFGPVIMVGSLPKPSITARSRAQSRR